MLCAIFFALCDAQVDDTLWTGPRWRLLVSANLPAAWTLNLLCSPPGHELALPAAASFSDRRISCLAVSMVPPFDFLLGSFGRCTILIVSTSRLYCTVHTPHTPDTSVACTDGNASIVSYPPADARRV